ncbi:flagellar biosynthetic protein FliQ [Buchnera aphidicola (Mollitrichosiphum nigrofasciatum)]|uniref:flagellar biosynthetic protein FliQ n=1 Tax=Buchnera aphidicola TaxID=9 RepID=UPI0031B865C7
MNIDCMNELFYESIKVFIILSSPLLFSALFSGLIISFLQTIIQIHEQNLSFIPKMFAIFLTFFYLGPWMLHVILKYMYVVFSNIPLIIFR